VKQQIKTIRFKNRNDFHESILDDFPSGGLFVQTDSEYALDEPVRVRACFPEIPEGVLLLCNVVWRRPPAKWNSALKPGIGVSVDSTDLHRWNFLMDYVTGSAQSKRVTGPRIASSIGLQLICDDIVLSTKAMNISPGGMFVSTDAPIAARTAIEMDISLEAKEPPIRHFGQVVWRQEVGGEEGLGVAFRYRNSKQRTQILNLMERETSQRLSDLFPGSYRVQSSKSRVAIGKISVRKSAEEDAINDLLSVVRQQKERQVVTPIRTTLPYIPRKK
jgi:Tfp pilus assembly protein PilZ